jgi:hypothetical protein
MLKKWKKQENDGNDARQLGPTSCLDVLFCCCCCWLETIRPEGMEGRLKTLVL